MFQLFFLFLSLSGSAVGLAGASWLCPPPLPGSVEGHCIHVDLTLGGPVTACASCPHLLRGDSKTSFGGYLCDSCEYSACVLPSS